LRTFEPANACRDAARQAGVADQGWPGTPAAKPETFFIPNACHELAQRRKASTQWAQWNSEGRNETMQIAAVFLCDHGRSMASIALKLFANYGSECKAN